MPAALSSDEFSARMARLGPFEAKPLLAVAVSGGADSMALALLARDWARAGGGDVVALTVDHRLRKESGEEAAETGRRLAGLGILQHILVRDGPAPAADIQAEARAARYELLGRFCREQGILHLLVAHNQDDQAETLLLRLARGSGLDGLAAMAPVSWRDFGRLLRPLLDIPHARLEATLKAAAIAWGEDPSNRNPAFARVRLRALAPALAAEGLDSPRLAATTLRLARAQDAIETILARAAIQVFVHPAGFAVVPPALFRQQADEVGLRLLARLLMLAGGGRHTPRLDGLERLFARLRRGMERPATLAGATVTPSAQGLLFCREAGRIEAPLALVPGADVLWDGRFRVRVGRDIAAGLTLGALGTGHGRRLVTALGHSSAIPAPARPGLPALFADGTVCAVPHLGYNDGRQLETLGIALSPSRPLTKPDFRPCLGTEGHYV